LLTAVIPRLGKLAKEEGGRHKVMQYTRYVTIVLCILQGYMLARTFENPANNPLLGGIVDTIRSMGVNLVANPGIPFEFMTVITLTAGTMFLMWIGDQITDRGVGNGMSLIITVGIAAKLPAALVQAWRTFVPTGGHSQVSPMVLVAMLAFLVIVIAGVICVTQAQRRITVQYAKRVVGSKMMGGGQQYMPLKVNYSGVMPIIFAQALIVFPSTLLTTAFKGQSWAQTIAGALAHGVWHYAFLGGMIFFFSYFWVATQFQPQQIAEDLKKYGGYVPGIRPGKETATFLDNVMQRLTFAGAVFLTVIALLPQMLAQQMNVPYITAQFFGGTSLLIIVGVILDTMRQVETYLIQRHYDGFLRKGRIRGRFDRTPTGRGEIVQQTTLIWAYAGIGLLVVIGLAVFLANHR
jgi:preprotein translocase subunit SecY